MGTYLGKSMALRRATKASWTKAGLRRCPGSLDSLGRQRQQWSRSRRLHPARGDATAQGEDSAENNRRNTGHILGGQLHQQENQTVCCPKRGPRSPDSLGKQRPKTMAANSLGSHHLPGLCEQSLFEAEVEHR